MAVTKLQVTYDDEAGTVVEVVATPRAQVMTERILREAGGFGEATVVEASFRLAWESLRSRKQLPTSASGGDAGYEEWLDMIADVIELEPVEVGPTNGAQSPTSSSD
jgi:hypothetical protein